jgi:DNA-binding transcriptional LysR family regulator
MWSTIELREIRVFLVLAEELHFGRAAQRLGLTSSRVSQILRELEAKLGAQLVYRTSRRVELTARGERFREDVADLHDQILGVLRRTHDEGREPAGTLRIGLLTPVIEGRHLPAMTSAFERRHPECRVEVSRAPYGDAFDCMRRGEIDLLVSWLPHGQPDLVDGEILAREPRVLAVAEQHPLAGRAAVSLEDIADYRVLPQEEVMPAELAEAWIPRKTPGGRTIRRLQVPFGEMARRDPSQLRQQMSWWIRTGEIVYPSVAPVQAILGAGIVYVPIADMPQLCSALVWRRGSSDRRVRDFVRVSEEVLRGPRRRASSRAA